jgi:hypothetical protein
MSCTHLIRKPSLRPEVMQELELHGLDAVRGLLTRSTDGFSGTTRQVTIWLGNISVTRGELQDWVKWKAARDACWIKVGVVAAIAAAVFSLLALLK